MVSSCQSTQLIEKCHTIIVLDNRLQDFFLSEINNSFDNTLT